jgi:hypothetical protein
VVMRRLTPPLGSMVAREAEAEGGFRAAHARLKAHAEEVAFLQVRWPCVIGASRPTPRRWRFCR